MPHERFFIETELDSSLDLKGNEFHHLSRVMRMREGETVELIDGKGHLATARIDSIQKHYATLTSLETAFEPPPDLQVHIALGILRMNRLEWAVEKATELGALSISLFPADYSEKKELSPNQLERLHHLAVSALKQSGGLYLPTFYLEKLDRILTREASIFFGDLDNPSPFPSPLTSPILFISGPERGFSPEEKELLQTKAKGVRLHPNILRAETTPLVALSALYALL